MSLTIIDSVGWIAYFTGDKLARGYRNHILGQSELVCPTIVLYEVSKKMELSVSRRAAAMAVAQMAKNHVVPLDQSISTYSARVSIAHGLAMADAIIYATTLLTSATLMTSDAHFQGLPHVEFIPHIA